MSGEQRLRASLHRLRKASPTPPAPLKPDPTNPFELAIHERLKAIEADLNRLRSRLNWLFTIILGAAVANVVLSLFT